MSKINKIGFFNKESGEELSKDILDSILKEDFSAKIRYIEDKFKNFPEQLELDEIELLLKIHNISSNVKLDFKKGGFFSIKINPDITKKLNIKTLGALFLIGENTSSEGRLVYENKKAIKSFDKLIDYLNISTNDWNRHIKKDFDEYNILRKENIDGEIYIIVNPLFLFKDRTISETMFIAFYDDIKNVLSPLQFLYLTKKYNICK